jgi:hypothetical protein
LKAGRGEGRKGGRGEGRKWRNEAKEVTELKGGPQTTDH